ncbi:MAG TPA: outer membrane beta-barrel protein [Devosia sp.]|nr:outer membrane beta-barrel protein [Devosia sp.]
MRPLRLLLAVVCALVGATAALAQDADEDDALGDGAVESSEQTSPLGLDWSVGMRGGYSANSITGGMPAVTLNPEASLQLGGESSLTRYEAGGELSFNAAGQGRVADLHGGVTGSLRLGPSTSISGSINGEVTQDEPHASGLPANTLHAPLELDGTAQGVLTQDMGRVDATLTLDGRRFVTGPTTLDDLSTVDNAHQSYWEGGGTLRLGYELTPLLSSFVEGETSVQKFDAPDPTLLTYLDGRTYQLRAGLSYTHGSVLSAEASIGRGWLDYYNGAIVDTQDWVYNGSVTFNPDETLSLVGALETALRPSDATPGDTDVETTLSSTARYVVNPWLTLRASGSWDRTVALGTGGNSWGLEGNLGLDYRSSRMLTWTADYTYARDYAPPAPVSDTHTVEVGVRIAR